jgi:hypothetical protein
VLESLVDKSLVRRSGDRFWMLETIREFALERLEETGGAEDLRGIGTPRISSSSSSSRSPSCTQPRSSSVWFDRLQAEHDNVRTVLGDSSTNAPTSHFGSAACLALLGIARLLERVGFRHGV